MRHAMILAGLALLVGAAPCVVGCFDYGGDCGLNPALPCFWDGVGGSGGTGGSSPECIPSVTNKTIDDACGKFVSADGSDGNDGSKEMPFLTMAHAVEVAIAKGESVYACADPTKPFDEVVEPTGEVAIYGGFVGCDKAWTYDPTTKSVWTAPADEVPLVAGGDAKVSVFDFVISARDAVKVGGSSIAVLAFGDTAALVMERCEVVAGNGKDGETPEKPAGTGTPGEDGKPGADGCVDTTGKLGGNGGQNMCEGVSREGGGGGNGTTVSGGPGGDGQPAGDFGKGGDGQIAANASTVGGAGDGGTEGDPGDGATELGTLSSLGYTGKAGKSGKTSGTPGQGGGGGGGAKVCSGNTNAGPGGGGGGAGGCGGKPGAGGGFGGASIGLVSAGATVTLSEVTVTANKGGAGGTGGDGQSGGKGGKGGSAGSENGDGEAQAQAGGTGGKGGNGGGGGGGLGGHSLGIAFMGAAPTMTKVTLAAGTAGVGGSGGNMTAIPTAKGQNGQACKTLSFGEGIGSCVK